MSTQTYIASQIDDLKSIQSSVLNILGWGSRGDGGEGIFLWDASKNKQLHDGGSVIDPSHSADVGSLAWYNPENTGNGCWIRQGEYDCRAFGLFPGVVERDVVQHFIEVQSAKQLKSKFPSGTYIGDTEKTFNERVLDLPSGTWVSAYKAAFEDLFWKAREVDGCRFDGGRYYNKAADTAWIFDVNVRNAIFDDVILDQEEPATTVSPWMIVRENLNMQPENIWFNRCIFKNRTNIWLMNCRNVHFIDPHVLNRQSEDGIVIKTRQGYGICENITLTGGAQEFTTAPIGIGTQVGEDVRNVKYSNIAMKGCTRAMFIESIDNVNAAEHYNQAHVSDVGGSNITIWDPTGLDFNNIMTLRCNSGSSIKRITLSDVTVLARSARSIQSDLFFLYVKEGSLAHDTPSFIQDVRVHGIIAEDRHPGATNPGDTDLNGETANGYQIDNVCKVTLDIDNFVDDIYITDLTTRGIAESSPANEPTGVKYTNLIMREK